jgi:hypothetical protein
MSHKLVVSLANNQESSMTATRLHSVIPPYILRRIIDNGSDVQQKCARQTLTHVQTLMAHMPGKPAAPHVAKAGQLQRDIYDAKQTQELPARRCALRAVIKWRYRRR